MDHQPGEPRHNDACLLMLRWSALAVRFEFVLQGGSVALGQQSRKWNKSCFISDLRGIRPSGLLFFCCTPFEPKKGLKCCSQRVYGILGPCDPVAQLSTLEMRNSFDCSIYAFFRLPIWATAWDQQKRTPRVRAETFARRAPVPTWGAQHLPDLRGAGRALAGLDHLQGTQWLGVGDHRALEVACGASGVVGGAGVVMVS